MQREEKLFIASSLFHLLVWYLFYSGLLASSLLYFFSYFVSAILAPSLVSVLLAACFLFVLLFVCYVYLVLHYLSHAISLLVCLSLFCHCCSTAASRLRSLFSFALTLLFCGGFRFFSFFRLPCAVGQHCGAAISFTSAGPLISGATCPH